MIAIYVVGPPGIVIVTNPFLHPTLYLCRQRNVGWGGNDVTPKNHKQVVRLTLHFNSHTSTIKVKIGF